MCAMGKIQSYNIDSRPYQVSKDRLSVRGRSKSGNDFGPTLDGGFVQVRFNELHQKKAPENWDRENEEYMCAVKPIIQVLKSPIFSLEAAKHAYCGLYSEVCASSTNPVDCLAKAAACARGR
jgi:hypothetical protein